MIITVMGPSDPCSPKATWNYRPEANGQRNHYFLQYNGSGTNIWLLYHGPNVINLDDARTNLLWVKTGILQLDFYGQGPLEPCLWPRWTTSVPWSGLTNGATLHYRDRYATFHGTYTTDGFGDIDPNSSGGGGTVAVEWPVHLAMPGWNYGIFGAAFAVGLCLAFAIKVFGKIGT